MLASLGFIDVKNATYPTAHAFHSLALLLVIEELQLRLRFDDGFNRFEERVDLRVLRD